ncbi:MAG: tRNA (adenosine(37)-N6)-threonylcarbamoyltransferase complex dimerization subunit type 1 TsaB [Candidatus Bipolaricaulota bacterium]
MKNPVKTSLGIDSATRIGSVALLEGERIIGEHSFLAEMSQSERLIPAINTVLTEADTERGDLNQVTASTGPGSFTGLRIGLSVAKGLCHALEIPLRGIPLTRAYYSRVRHYPGPVCTVIADRRNLVYYAVFAAGKQLVEEKSRPVEEMVLEVQQICKDLDYPVFYLGDGVLEHERAIAGSEGARLASGRLNYPSAAQIALLALTDDFEDEVNTVEPLYAQRPVAEKEFEQSS